MNYNSETIVGALFHEERQPYGSLYVRITECRQWTQADVDALKVEYATKYQHFNPGVRREQHLADNGYFMLKGVVESGKTVSRLFQHTSTRDEAGTAWSHDHIDARELARAHCVSVAM